VVLTILEDKLHRALKAIQRFGKHYSCHHQGEYVPIAWDLMESLRRRGSGDVSYGLLYTRLAETPKQYDYPEDGKCSVLRNVG